MKKQPNILLLFTGQQRHDTIAALNGDDFKIYPRKTIPGHAK